MCLVVDVLDELHNCDDWNLFMLMINLKLNALLLNHFEV